MSKSHEVVEIKKNIPMPRKQSSRTLDLPFEDMDVGDSFEISTKEALVVHPEQGLLDESVGMEGRIRSAAYRNGKRLNRRFAVRRIDDTMLGVWRTE